MIAGFIENIGEYFSSNYFDEDFVKKVLQESKHSEKEHSENGKKVSKIKEEYFKFKKIILEERLRTKDEIFETHKFHSALLEALGYDVSRNDYKNPFHFTAVEVIPIRHIIPNGDDNQIQLMILEIRHMIKKGDEEPEGLFEQSYIGNNAEKTINSEQKYHRSQWSKVFQIESGLKLSPMVVNDCISKLALLEKPQRPQFILLLGGNKLFLTEPEKWLHGSYLSFDLETLFSLGTSKKNYFTIFYLLTCRENLCPRRDSLISRLDEASYKIAHEVTKDLREGVIYAVEMLANEFLYYQKHVLKEEFDETDETIQQGVKDDSLTLVYRLLFLFYAEARPKLGILPIRNQSYLNGYSLEMLRDLEQIPLTNQKSKDGYFFHDSLYTLFGMLNAGFSGNNNSFNIKQIDSPLFDDSKLKFFGAKSQRIRTNSPPPN